MSDNGDPLNPASAAYDRAYDESLSAPSEFLVEMALSASGRGHLVATARIDAEGVSVRLDDEADPAFWAEVVLTEQHLTEILAAIHAHKSL